MCSTFGFIGFFYFADVYFCIVVGRFLSLLVRIGPISRGDIM
jgi:hypothetical protein